MIKCTRCGGMGGADSSDPPGFNTCPRCTGNRFVASVAELRDRIENPPAYYEHPSEIAAWFYYYGPQDHPYRDLNYQLAHDGFAHVNDLIGLIEHLEKWEAES